MCDITHGQIWWSITMLLLLWKSNIIINISLFYLIIEIFILILVRVMTLITKDKQIQINYYSEFYLNQSLLHERLNTIEVDKTKQSNNNSN